jgi:hypothetical protein
VKFWKKITSWFKPSPPDEREEVYAPGVSTPPETFPPKDPTLTGDDHDDDEIPVNPAGHDELGAE